MSLAAAFHQSFYQEVITESDAKDHVYCFAPLRTCCKDLEILSILLCTVDDVHQVNARIVKQYR